MKQECSSEIQNDACAACLAKESLRVSRRSFFASLLGACAGLIVTVIGTPMLRYILYPVQAGASPASGPRLETQANSKKVRVP